ncbi:hypothetical protein Ais01nite_74310 [Asanoa ishikariensis]|uniref:CYTH domain-containing protein n=1 Tax=Asanoa ishikariensis TaxID=137265 RepID=UPI001A573A09|nr:hypothetical protein Ais01nite_74310 [Asanoa ishikariensis]
MGFRPTVRIVKTRRTAQRNGLVVCLDRVRGLGTFLEVERMVGSGDETAVVQGELASFVESLGVEARRTPETYDALIHAAAG